MNGITVVIVATASILAVGFVVLMNKKRIVEERHPSATERKKWLLAVVYAIGMFVLSAIVVTIMAKLMGMSIELRPENGI